MSTGNIKKKARLVLLLFCIAKRTFIYGHLYVHLHALTLIVKVRKDNFQYCFLWILLCTINEIFSFKKLSDLAFRTGSTVKQIWNNSEPGTRIIFSPEILEMFFHSACQVWNDNCQGIHCPKFVSKAVLPGINFLHIN
jgi:hypothetical protein